MPRSVLLLLQPLPRGALLLYGRSYADFPLLRLRWTRAIAVTMLSV